MGSSKATGAICILAYPEEFVSMIPAWYSKPMEWAGMVNKGKTCVGHAAMALIEKSTGQIHYADFGRYITAFGYGRTRMLATDPDVKFDFKVLFDQGGNCQNKLELFEHFYQHPEKTHGGNVMFASINEDIDFEAAFNFITSMNMKGSIIYDPFKKGASNCSRFVFDAILTGMVSDREKKKLRRKSLITPSPLANVFHGTSSESYEFTREGVAVVQDTSIRKIISYFFNKPPEFVEVNDNPVDLDHATFLDGVGDQAYIFTKDILENQSLVITKLDAKGRETFTKKYLIPDQFDPHASYQFIYDCNAHWMTVLQNKQSFRLLAIEE